MVTEFLHPGAKERQVKPDPPPAPPRQVAYHDYSEVSPPHSVTTVDTNHRRVVLYQADGTPLVRKVGF